VKRADEYCWSSYRVHGLGASDELVDPLITFEELSPLAKVRQRKWAEKVHLPIEEATLDAVRRSAATGLPYGELAWVKRLAKRLELELVIRPRGRPRNSAAGFNK
jgi:hypothetical protein